MKFQLEEKLNRVIQVHIQVQTQCNRVMNRVNGKLNRVIPMMQLVNATLTLRLTLRLTQKVNCKQSPSHNHCSNEHLLTKILESQWLLLLRTLSITVPKCSFQCSWFPLWGPLIRCIMVSNLYIGWISAIIIRLGSYTRSQCNSN